MNAMSEEAPLAAPERDAGEVRFPRKLGDFGSKAITMAQIAKAAGVSQGAISSLLNDRDYGIRVSEKTRERVFKVCREMGYVPNDLRAVVRMYPEMGEVCVLLSSSIAGGISNPFVARIAHGVMKAVSEASHPVTFAIYADSVDYGSLAAEELPQPIRTGVASKFICYGPPNASLLQQLHRRGSPVVVLGSEVLLPGVVSLVPDFPAASRLAISQCFKLGHKQIGIVSGPFGTTDAPVIELHRGIKAAYDECHTAIEAQNIVYGDLSYHAGRRALTELLSHPVKPTAIFCLSDASAAGVLTEAQTRGLRVPEDLSVIGCGDDACTPFGAPDLTTVHLPAEEMAAEALREVERLVSQGVPVQPRKRLLPVRMVERASMGPVKVS